MTYRNLLLAACASAILLAAFAGRAMPLTAPMPDDAVATGIIQADYHEHDDDDHGRHASNDCRRDDNDDDGCGVGSGTQPQDAPPPSNGLFTPGSKPHAQMN